MEHDARPAWPGTGEDGPTAQTAPAMTAATAATLTGIIDVITYQNVENGYTVARLTPDATPACARSVSVTIVGSMLGIAAGFTVAATGRWTTHAQYGRQFRAERVELRAPRTTNAMVTFLGSGLIKGLGPKTAERVVVCFGMNTLRVLDEEPARLREVEGIGPAKARDIAAAWAAAGALRELGLYLQPHGVTAAMVVKLHERYGDRARAVIDGDPYVLTEMTGIGFLRADKLARALGLSMRSPQRIAAGLRHALDAAADDDGHTFLPRGELRDRARALLLPAMRAEALASDGPGESYGADACDDALLPLDLLDEPLRALVARGDVTVTAPSGGSGVDRAGLRVYRTTLHRAERSGTDRLLAILDAPPLRALPTGPALDTALAALDTTPETDGETATAIALAPAQRESLRLVLGAKVSVLTGGPGTGKTTTLRALLRLLDAHKVPALLAAPTGRAARRMREATGHPAATIHRLLEYNPATGWGCGPDNPLPTAVVIVDEASMIDLVVFNALLRALPLGTHLVLVGDADQLPSVGPGNVLADVIASGVVPVARLTTIFRQAEASAIVRAAHAINRGIAPAVDRAPGQDLYVLPVNEPSLRRAACRDQDAVAYTLTLLREMVTRRIPALLGLDSCRDIQVLTPMKRGPLGSIDLSVVLQEWLNPSSSPAHEIVRGVPGGPGGGRGSSATGGRVYRLGDRVIQEKNDYDKLVWNGDTGNIVEVDRRAGRVVVRFPGDGDAGDRRVTYENEEIDALALAYAITIHRSQGGEYPAVVLIATDAHHIMFARRLLYTGVTRARRLCVLLTTRAALARAVHNVDQSDRYSALDERLAAGGVPIAPVSMTRAPSTRPRAMELLDAQGRLVCDDAPDTAPDSPLERKVS